MSAFSVEGESSAGSLENSLKRLNLDLSPSKDLLLHASKALRLESKEKLLPFELWEVITQFMSIADLARLGQTCQSLHLVSKENTHWKKRCLASGMDIDRYAYSHSLTSHHKIKWIEAYQTYQNNRKSWFRESYGYSSVQAHDHAVSCIETDVDGLVVTGSWDGSIRIWRILDNHEESNESSTRMIYDMTGESPRMSPNWFAASDDFESSIEEEQKGIPINRHIELVHHLESHSGPLEYLYWLDKERILAAAKGDPIFRVWHVASGRLLKEYHVKLGDSFGFILNGIQSMVTEDEGRGTLEQELQKASEKPSLNCMDLFEDRIAFSDGFVLWILDIPVTSTISERSIGLLPTFIMTFQSHSTDLKFVKRDLLLSVDSSHGFIIIINLNDPLKPAITHVIGTVPGILSCRVVPSKKNAWDLISGFKDGNVRTWTLNLEKESLEISEETPNLSCLGDWTTCVDTNMSSDIIVAGSWDCRIRVWDAKKRTLNRTLKSDAASAILCLKTLDKMVITGSYNGCLTIWQFT